MQKNDLLVVAIMIIAAGISAQYAESCCWITLYEKEKIS